MARSGGADVPPSALIALPTFVGSRGRAGRVCGVAFAVLVIACWCIFIARFVLHGPPTAERLAWSVATETGSAALFFDTPACKPTGKTDRWTCTMLDSGASGSVAYDVRVRPGTSCWTGRLVRESGEFMPERASSCVPLFALTDLG